MGRAAAELEELPLPLPLELNPVAVGLADTEPVPWVPACCKRTEQVPEGLEED